MDKPINDKKRRRVTKVDYLNSKDCTVLTESPKKRPLSTITYYDTTHTIHSLFADSNHNQNETTFIHHRHGQAHQ